VFAKGQLLDTPVAEARRLMEVNYIGALLVSQAFLEPLMKTGGRRGFLDPACLVMVNSFASKVREGC
jgi:NAD(P)-dependent dehydrogenase (short-subunit alcohol dehydrogenase family)